MSEHAYWPNEDFQTTEQLQTVVALLRLLPEDEAATLLMDLMDASFWSGAHCQSKPEGPSTERGFRGWMFGDTPLAEP